MTPTERLLYERLRRRATLLQPELARRYLQALDAIRQALTEAELAAAIQSGQVEALLNQILTDDVLDPAFRPLRSTIDEAVLGAAKQGVAELPIGDISFNILNPRVLEAARRLDTRVIRGLKADVRESIRAVVTDGLAAGENPRAIARTAKRFVGMSERHAQAVRNFERQLQTGDRSALDRVLGRGIIRQPNGTEITRRAHADQQGLTSRDLLALDHKLGREDLRPDQIRRMVDAYAKRLHALNAETQTRTMALDAMRAGARGSWDDAIAQGSVDRSLLRRTWVAVDDERTRPEHRALNGATVTWDQPYPNGEMLPGESTYGCRCIERVTIARDEAIAA